VPRCVECEREFDLMDEQQAEEWFYGHDCEPVEDGVVEIGIDIDTRR
jgi:NOL1/NOP2/fmu family ribosome biogenesis protein